MAINIFSNNAKTTLASSITSTQTSITVAPGTGALFPNPTLDQSTFKVTFVSASDDSIYEICNCISRTGDVLTVVRAQEGTTGTPFLLNDIVGHFCTAGVMTDLVQSEQYQDGTYAYAAASGTADALTATINSNLSTIGDGFKIFLKSTASNTGATTLALTLTSTILAPRPIVTGNNVPLTAGQIPAANYQMALLFNATHNAFVLLNPASINLPSSLTNNGYQVFPGGLIMQWGTTTQINAGATLSITYPIPFPNAIFGYPNCSIGSLPTVNAPMSMFVPLNVTTVGCDFLNADVDSGASVKWFALGN